MEAFQHLKGRRREEWLACTANILQREVAGGGPIPAWEARRHVPVSSASTQDAETTIMIRQSSPKIVHVPFKAEREVNEVLSYAMPLIAMSILIHPCLCATLSPEVDPYPTNIQGSQSQPSQSAQQPARLQVESTEVPHL